MEWYVNYKFHNHPKKSSSQKVVLKKLKSTLLSIKPVA